MRSSQPYSATVPRELVHRSAVSEVFLTGHSQSSPTAPVSMEAQLPRSHSYYSDHLTAPASYDALLLMEVCRQASIVMAHVYLDAPFDSAFIFDVGDLRIVTPEAFCIGASSAGLDLTVETVGEKRRAGKRAGAVLDITAAVNGREALTARMDFRWLPRSTWASLRERGRAALDLTPRANTTGKRLDSALVGRRLRQNVVLSEGSAVEGTVVTDVIVDQAHPALFDHALDHIPGAVIFEAIRQSALFAAHELQGLSSGRLSLTGVRAHFSTIGEFELPTHCRVVRASAEAAGCLGYEVDVMQEERVITSAQVSLTQTARSGQPLVVAREPAGQL